MLSSTQIYARLFGIALKDVQAHKAEQLALLLFAVGCTIRELGGVLSAQLPGERKTRGLRSALNTAKKRGLVRGRLRGSKVPAVEVSMMVRGELRCELRVWCISCQRFHLHGFAGGYGPRIPHCVDRAALSAYADSYELVPPLAAKRRRKRAASAGRP